jgi:hypothetical protein
MESISKIITSHRVYSLTKNTAKTIVVFPILISFFLLLIIAIPFTRNFGFWLLEENNPIEILTFIFFILGGIYGVFLSIKLFKSENNKLPAYFFLIFSIFLVLIGMEEISWGQQFFNFKTPDDWNKINLQGETTLHNVGFMQTHTDTLHLVFGIAGLVGILLRNHSFFKKIGIPIILLSWFLIIVIQSIADIIVDVINAPYFLDHTIEKMSEFIELVIACAAALYLWLNNRLLNNI